MPHRAAFQKQSAAMSVDELTKRAESLTQLSDRVAFISEAARVLASSIDYAQTFECLSRLIVPRIADWVTINRLLPDGRFERVAHHHVDPAFNERLHRMNLPPPPRDAKVGVSQVLKTAESILVPEDAHGYISVLERAGWSPALIGVLREMKLVSAMAVPMVRENQVIGGLTVFTTEQSGRHYNKDDLRMAQELATLAALAIHNSTLHRRAVDEVQRMQVLETMRDEYIRKQIHDIRTPLTALSMLIELIGRSPPVPERIQNLVERARLNIARASEMLGNLRTNSPSKDLGSCNIIEKPAS